MDNKEQESQCTENTRALLSAHRSLESIVDNLAGSRQHRLARRAIQVAEAIDSLHAELLAGGHAHGLDWSPVPRAVVGSSAYKQPSFDTGPGITEP